MASLTPAPGARNRVVNSESKRSTRGCRALILQACAVTFATFLSKKLPYGAVTCMAGSGGDCRSPRLIISWMRSLTFTSDPRTFA